MGACLSDSQLDQYHGGEVDPERAAVVERHLGECGRCAERSAAMVSEHDAFLGRIRSWDRPSKDAALDKTSEWGNPHTQRLPMEHTLDVGAPTADGGSIPGYDVIREIHRGGQGIVYQAIQRSTKRKVAVKVLLDGAYASRAARKRFEREIELVANLKHSHIVSIFDSGVTPDGRQFCVMDYVAGVRLDQYVRERKVAMEDALKLFVTISEAVNYAHQRGVIHRDLKPSNILVDAEGAPKILDFGLAKRLSGPADTLLSMSQHIVGTLPYMSPEQARGATEEADIRSDVYSLGVVLYELLTGHYPYPVIGEMAEVLQHITQTHPSPPDRAWEPGAGIRAGENIRRRSERSMTSSSRVFRKARRRDGCPINDEVKTIVYKSLAKERERRYQSAGELARDIDRYLAGEPIEAKRDSGWYMLRKTLTRHRTPVVIVSGFLVLLLAFGTTMAVLYTRANVAEERAQRRFTQVRELAKSFIGEFHAAIADLPGSTPARKLLVTKALEYLDNLSREVGADRDLLMELAVAYGMVGDVQGSVRTSNVGDTQGALQSFQKEKAILDRLDARFPGDAKIRHGLVMSHRHLGDMAWAEGDTEVALKHYEESRDIAQSILRADSSISEVQRSLIISFQDIGDTMLYVGRTEEALTQFRQALDWVEKSPLDPEDPTSIAGDAAFCHDKIGEALQTLGRTDESLAAYQSALRLRRQCSAAHPDNGRYKALLAASLERICFLFQQLGRKDEARRAGEESLALREAQAKADPTDARGQRTLCGAYDIMAGLAQADEQWDEALRYAQLAMSIRERQAAADPINATNRECLAVSHSNIARVQEAKGNHPEALAGYRKSNEIREALLEANPGNLWTRNGLGRTYARLAGLQAQMGENEASEQSYLKCTSLWKEITAADPKDADAGNMSALAHQLFGDFLVGRRRPKEGMREYDESIALLERLIAAAPQYSGAVVNLARTLLRASIAERMLAEENGASVEQKRGHEARACAALQRGIGMLQPLAVVEGPETKEAKELLAEMEAERAACDSPTTQSSK